MRRLLFSALLGIGLTACSSDHGATASSSEGGAAGSTSTDSRTTSFARVEQGEILGVGVVVPVKSFEDVPRDDPAFDSSVGLEMPSSVRDQTFIQLLRVNWLPGGHGPEPYTAPHFDLHFYRGTKDEVTAINCDARDPFPAEV